MSKKRQQPSTSDCNCWALSSFYMGINSYHAQAHTCTHKWTIQRMLTATAADSNCSFEVERECKEWYCEEFQISKAIFHFPPGEGIHALTVFRKHRTSETHSSTKTACVLS